MKKNFILKIIKLKNKIKLFLKPFYVGFISSHRYLKKSEILDIKAHKDLEDKNLVSLYESKFRELIGNGKCFSYAAARMCFYEILKYRNLSKEDEVILLGFTCSVMANAVIRIGAKIIYSDIDINNYGSCAESIKKLITKRTKVIVAQHSFGVPCEIEEIAKIASLNKLFLIEDCSLSLSSKFKGITLGNFGDAAIFSTDHTKPINTITGGILYTKDKNLIRFIINSKKNCSDLTQKNKNYLWDLFNFERKFCNPYLFGKAQIFSLIYRYIERRLKYKDNDLYRDLKSIAEPRNTYPSNLPTFCAAIGLIEIENWQKTMNIRKKNLNKFITIAKKNKLKFSNAYFDKRNEIVPLRIPIICPNELFLKNIKKYVDSDSSWFMKPIIGTNEPLLNFQYKEGDCKNSEIICKSIVNIPLSTNSEDFEKLLNSIGFR